MRTLQQVQPLVFTWPYALVFWLVAAWVFLPEMRLTSRSRRGVRDKSSPDAGSMTVIIVGQQIATFVAAMCAGFGPTLMPLDWRRPCYFIGLVLIVSGSLLRRHCWRVLGEFFTGDVQARTGQPVVDRGAYRWLRHPSYTGGFLIFIGVGIAFSDWLSLALTFASTVLTYSYRVRVEERTLLAVIGEPYRRFMESRKRFIPFVI